MRSSNGFLGVFTSTAELSAKYTPSEYAGCSANIIVDGRTTKYWCDGTTWNASPILNSSGTLIGPDGSPVSGGGGSAAVGPTQLESPMDLSGVVAWFDATNTPRTTGGVNYCADGGVVASWNDGATGNSATTVAGSPVYRANAGIPGVEFTSGAYMRTGAAVFAAGMSQAFHMFACVTPAVDYKSYASRGACGAEGHSTYLAFNGTTMKPDYAMASMTGGAVANAAVLTDPAIMSIGVLSDGTSKVATLNNFGSTLGSSSAYTMTVTGAANTAMAGHKLVIGAPSASTGSAWRGLVHEVLVFGRGLTLEEIRQVNEYLAIKWGKTKNMVVLGGNSLTSGTGTTTGANQQIALTGDNYPSYLQATLGVTWDVVVDAYPGRRNDQIFTESVNYADKIVWRGSAKRVYVLWETSNGLALYDSLARAKWEVQKICAQRRTAGYKVLVCTTIQRGDAGANFAVDAAAFNSWLKSNYASFADGVIDLAADARLQDYSSATYFAGDLVHLNSVGAAVVAGLVAPAVLAA